MKKKYLPLFLPVRCVLFLLFFVISAAAVNKSVSDISNWWSIADTLLNIVTIALLVFLARKSGQTYPMLINYEKGRTKPKQIVLMSLMIVVVAVLSMYLVGFICYGVIPYSPPMMIEPIPKLLAVINIPLLPVTSALSEDGLYLGCGVNQMKNKYAAILVPAFFYALQHSFIPTLFDTRYIVYRFLMFLPLTVILCAIYYKKRDPLPIMVGHAIVDVATVMQILATSFIPGFYDKMCSMAQK